MSEHSRRKLDIYRRYAPSYDADRRLMHGDEALRDRALRLTEDIIADDLVLDVGCGTGDHLTMAAELAGRRGRVLGLDLSLSMLRQAREKARGYPTVGLALCDASGHLPVPDRFFDVVICDNLGQDMADLVGLLRECRRVLRVGGMFAATIACLDGPSEAHAVFQEAAREYLWYFPTYRNVLHALADAGLDPLDGTVNFVATGASQVQADGLLEFLSYGDLMNEVRSRGHDPLDVAQGFALVKLRRR